MNHDIPIYSSLPVGQAEIAQLAPNPPRAIVVRDHIRTVPVDFIAQSELWGNPQIKKALRIFPITGLMSISLLTCSYTAAFYGHLFDKTDIVDEALTVAKWSQICWLGNLAVAGGVQLLSKISGRRKVETKNLIFNTLAGSFPCLFAGPVYCEVAPDARTITVMREITVD